MNKIRKVKRVKVMYNTQNVDVLKVEWGKSESLERLGNSVFWDWMGSDEAKNMSVRYYGFAALNENVAIVSVNGSEHDGVVIPIPITPEMFDLFCKEAGVA